MTSYESYIDGIISTEEYKAKLSISNYEDLTELLESSEDEVVLSVIDQQNAIDCSMLDDPAQKITNDKGAHLVNPVRIRIFANEDLESSPDANMRVIASIFVAKEGTVIQTSSSFDQDGKEYKNYRDLSIPEQNGLYGDMRRHFGIT